MLVDKTQFTVVPQWRNSLSTKTCTFSGDCGIPNICNKKSVDILISDVFINVYINTEIDALFANIGFSNYYDKTEVNTIVANQIYRPSKH